jgi:flagellar L-ring protein precursor FlgH
MKVGSTMKQNLAITGLALLACTAMTACGAGDRISQIGKAPELASIANPTTQEGYQPVSLPMPAPRNITQQRNSLWASDRVTFFKDQRAADVGDIITVLIDIDDEAKMDNETERSRNASEGASLGALVGLEQRLDEILPQGVDNTNLVAGESDSVSNGSGSIDRKEEVELQLAALVTQILPNGNMVIHGQQEVRVNFEKRVLSIDGVIRPQDITVNNTVSYQQIAEARIGYGGQGQITDVQQPRYGQQLYDVIFPF